MSGFILAFAYLLPLLQDDDTQARRLIDFLRSDSLERRDEAFRRLEEMGARAAPELERVKGDGDPEVARRVAWLLRLLDVQRKAPARLREMFPGVERRIASGQWEEVLGQAARSLESGTWIHPRLGWTEAEYLVRGVLSGNSTGASQILACEIAAEMTIGTAAREIATLLKSKDQEVRIAAVATLGKLRAREFSAEIATLLKDEDSSIRSSATWALGNFGKRESATEIARLLSDESEHVQASVADALGRLGAKEYAAEISQLLNSKSSSTRVQAARALWRLGGIEFVPNVAAHLKDDSGLVRCEAIAVLGAMGAKQYVPHLVRLLKDKDELVREYACRALGVLRAYWVAEDLAEFLKDENAGVRKSGCAALGILRARKFAPEVAKLLEDPCDNVHLAAVVALGQMGANEYAFRIAGFLNSGRPGMSKGYVVDALSGLGAIEVIPRVAKLLGDEGLGIKAASIEILGRLGARDYVSEIAKLVTNDAPWDVRWKGAEAIGRMGSQEHAALVAMLLKSENSLVRGSALRALGELGSRGHSSVVVEYLEDENDTVRSTAAFALGRTGTKEHAPRIVSLLRDRDKSVRMSAARALGDLEATDFSSEIARLLEDPEEVVRVRSADVLCRMGRHEGIEVLLGPVWDTGRMLVSLNALRFPKGWSRLKDGSWKGSEWMNRKNALRRLVADAGGILDMSEEVERDPFWGTAVHIRKESTLVRALEAILEGGSWDAILEDKASRIVSHEEALNYWKQWWKDK